MAIAFDAVSDSGFQNTGSTYSWNHTCTGSNLVLVVNVCHNAGASGEVTGVTYNGVALTHVTESINNLRSCDVWYLLGPATGTNAIQVTFSTSRDIWGSAVSLTGVVQSGQPDASITGNSAATNTVSASLTTVADNSWIVAAVLMDDQNNAPCALSPGTDRFQSGTFAGNFATALGTSGPISPAASTTETYSQGAGSSARNALVLVSFAPAGGSTFTAKFRKTLSSVGTGVGKRQVA